MSGSEDIIVARRKTPPYWWPDVNALLQLFLAVSIVFMVGFILFQIMSNEIKLNQDQDRLLMILFGIILGCFKDVFGYTFGSSAGQKRQGEVITQSLQDKDKTIADNAAAAATAVAAVTPLVDVTAAARAAAPAAAAEAAAPAAAEAAPPAAEAAAPAAAEKAVDDALAARDKPKE